jgi:hypothetical protein
MFKQQVNAEERIVCDKPCSNVEIAAFQDGFWTLYSEIWALFEGGESWNTPF